LKPRHVEVEVSVVEVAQEPVLRQVSELVEIHHIPGIRVDFPLYRQLQLIVVPVKIRMAALPEGLPVPLFREPRIEETVRGVEVHAAGHAAAGHIGWAIGYGLWAIGYWLLAAPWS